MEAHRIFRPIAGFTCLVFTVAIAGTAIVAPVGQRATEAAYDVTELFIDPEPDPVVTYSGSHESYTISASEINKVETGYRTRGGLWIRYEPTYTSGRGTWSFAFAPPKGEKLAVGNYPNAGHIEYREDDEPGISVQGATYCSDGSGRFTVHELHTTDTEILVLSVSFRYKCGEKGRPFNPGWVYGEVRYNASTGFKAADAAPQSLDFGTHAVGTDAGTKNVTVTSLGALPVTLGKATIAGQDETAFTVASNACNGVTLQQGQTCTVGVSAKPHAGRALVARLRIADDTYRGRRTVPLKVAGGPDPVWSYDWGEVGTASRKYSWTSGNALAVTDATKPRLQTIYTSPFINGKWAKDSGPFIGLFHARKSPTATRWSAAKRINQKKLHGSRAAIAASGSGVYATWVGMKKYVDYKPKAPRVLYFRRNLNEGASSNWGPIVRLSSKTGRVGYPAIAADGPNVYLAWTASGSGKVMLATSRDRGKTWKKESIGTTTSKSSSGFYGAPAIAVDGNDLIVSWWPRKDTTVKVRISADGGQTFGAASVVGSASWQPDVAVRNGRFGIALARGDGLTVRLREGGTWGAFQRVPDYRTTKPQSPSLVLRGQNGVGIAWPACSRNCWFANRVVTESRLLWRYSADDGERWSKARTLAAPKKNLRMANDTPSLVWPDGGRRAVLFGGWTWKTTNFRAYLVQGIAIDPATAGPRVTVAADEPPPVYPDLERPPGRR